MEQPIQGAGLLDSIKSMLFKGLDNAFNSASEYEEEMGVLKQVTRIPLEDESGKETPYTLTIKLAPIKGKSGKYYVEAETTAPNLDVSSINGKVLPITNSSMKGFNKMIDDLLEANSLTRTENTSAEQQTDEEQANETSSNDVMTDEQEQEIADMIAQAAKEKGIEYRTVQMEDGHVATLYTELQQRSTNPELCDMTISAEDPFEQKPIRSLKSATKVVAAVDSNGETLSFTAFCNELKAQLDAYMKANKLTEQSTREANASTHVDVTFIKSSKDNEISLTAINASCNIQAALDMIESVADDAEFLNELVDDSEQSYRITDDGDSLDVIEIESVDTSSTYDIMFDTISKFSSKLQTYRWAMGSRTWYDSTTISAISDYVSELLDQSAVWVIQHTDHYPAIRAAYTEFPNLAEFEDEEGHICKDCLEEDVVADTEELILLLDNYYVNLEHDEQTRIDGIVSELKRLLTYA